MVWGDHGPFAFPLNQRPPVTGLEPVFVFAQRVEPVGRCAVGVGPIVPMVNLQVALAVASQPGALRLLPQQRSALIGRGVAAQVNFPKYLSPFL